MSETNWSGLITNASPFVIPVGGAIEQVNLCSDTPGQIYSRGGMASVSVIGQMTTVRDVHAYESDGEVLLVAITPDGLAVATSPAVQQEVEPPLDPLLLSVSGSTETNYLFRYRTSGDDPQPPLPPPDGGGTDGPPAGTIIQLITGGSAATPEEVFPFYVDANNQCDQENPIDHFLGGLSGEDFSSASLDASRLCRNPFREITVTGPFRLQTSSGDILTGSSGRWLSVYGTVYLREE